MNSPQQRVGPPVSPPAGSFRRATLSPGGTDRIPDILAGNEKLMAEAVYTALTHGLAVMFGPTRDGGALGVHAWYGARHWKDYVASAEELEDVLEGLRDFKPAQPGPTPLAPRKTRPERS